AHDIGAALSDVLGGLRLIETAEVDPAIRLQLDRVRAAGELLARLVEEGLAAIPGASDPPAPGNVQLARLVADLAARWGARARGKALEFRLDLQDDLPPVILTERTGLERSLSNILSNAVKYTDSGAVELAVFRVADGRLIFRVRDDGPGFSGEALARLFEFEGRPGNADRPGEGLGLHIAWEQATRAGGALVARNRPEGGAEVVLSLPADACASAVPDGDLMQPLPDLSRIRVLVAEDNPTNQRLMATMLERMGAEVEMASDGIEAITALEQGRFDIALIDIEMPRLTGIHVIRALRAMSGPQAELPVLAVTAYVMRANREALYAAGADGIIAKPFGTLEAFGAAIARALRKTAPEPQLPVDRPGPDAVRMDPERFDRLLSVAGPTTARTLLLRLDEDLRHARRKLAAARTGPDWAEIRAQTHVLIALAGAVGALLLQNRAETLNAMAHARENGTSAALEEVLELLDALIEFVAAQQSGAAS
ncbi:MAG: response regulator, partial [Gemmobacter sp.]